MRLSTFEALFPPEKTPLIDTSEGTLILAGRNLLRGLWNRTGQGSGVIPSVAVGVIATGNSQLTSFGLTDDWNEIDTVAANTGVQIPQLQPGQGFCLIFNGGASTLRIYPIIGSKIDALATNAPYQLAAAKMQLFSQWTLTQLRSVQLG